MMHFGNHFTGERRLIFRGGPDHHEPMNADEQEPTYKERRWQKLADALTGSGQYRTTVSIFRKLEEDFARGNVDRDYLKAAHEYVMSIAENRTDMTRDEILTARPLNLNETYDFVRFVLDNAAKGPQQPHETQEEPSLPRNGETAASSRGTAGGFRRRAPAASHQADDLSDDPDMIRARGQRHLPIEQTDLFRHASPRAQERALRIQQLGRELEDIRERESDIRSVMGRIRELRARHDRLIAVVRERMKSGDPETRAHAEKLYGTIRAKERAIERDVAARWPDYKRPAPGVNEEYGDFNVRADEWVSRAAHVADAYAALQREIEESLKKETAVTEEDQEKSPSDRIPAEHTPDHSSSVRMSEPEVIPRTVSVTKRATSQERKPVIDAPQPPIGMHPSQPSVQRAEYDTVPDITAPPAASTARRISGASPPAQRKAEAVPEKKNTQDIPQISALEEFRKYQESLNTHFSTRTTVEQINENLKTLDTAIANIRTYPASKERAFIEELLTKQRGYNSHFAQLDKMYPGSGNRLAAARAEMVRALRASIRDPGVTIRDGSALFAQERDGLFVYFDLVKDGKWLGTTSARFKLLPDGTIMVMDTSAGAMNWDKRRNTPLTDNLLSDRITRALQGNNMFYPIGDALGVPRSAMQFYQLDAEWTEADIRSLFKGQSLREGLSRAARLKSLIEDRNGRPMELMMKERVHMRTIAYLLQMSTEPNAVDVMRALLSDRTFNLGFSAENRTEFNPAQDRSTFKLVCRRMANVSPNTPDFAQHVQAEWVKQRNLQWESFKSEEMTPDGPKPTDVLVIYLNEFAGQRAATMNIFKELNAFNKNGDTNTHEICIDDCADLADLNRRINEVSAAYQSNGRHLAVVLDTHGSDGTAGGIRERGKVLLPFRRGSVRGDITELSVQQVHSSLFYNPCFGGEHAIGAAGEGRLKTGFWSGAENTVNFSTNLERAVNGMARWNDYPADYNKDGKISLGEMRYFLDTVNDFQDNVLFDTRGNRIAAIREAHGLEGLS